MWATLPPTHFPSDWSGGIVRPSKMPSPGYERVWRLDLRWPADWMAPEEALALRDQGELPESLIRAAWEVWCREPRPGEQWREI